jgi:hypothetical protein
MRPQDRDSEHPLLEPEAESKLGEALRSAWAPTEIDPAVNEQLIEAALVDPFAPATEDEVRESERLRAALEGQADHPATELCDLLRAASDPTPLEPRAAERLVPQQLRKHRGNVIYVAFGAAAAVAALAAALALLVSPVERPEPAATRSVLPVPQRSLAVSRSTAPLFDSKFETGETTARIDRITLQREREFRDNRYAAWGLR